MIEDSRGEENMGKLTGSRYCEDCEYFHRDIDGVYCVLPSFDGAYTKDCPKRSLKNMNKRETALEIIKIEYAKCGKETRESMRAYVENRISTEARNEAVKRGLKMFEKGERKTKEERVTWTARDEEQYYNDLKAYREKQGIPMER